VTGLQVSVSEETAPAGFVAAAASAFFTDAVDTTLTATRVIASGNQIRVAVRLEFLAGQSIDITYRVKAVQLEPGAVRTAYQANRSHFDITEAGVRDIPYLAPDGVDDWMALAAGFAPAGAYTAAALADIQTAASNKHFFGKASGGVARFFRNTGNGLEFHANTSINRTAYSPAGFPGAVTGRSLQLVRVTNVAAPADGFVNGVPLTNLSPLGDMRPLGGGLDTLFRSNADHGAPLRLYGAFLIDRAITDAERALLEAYMAHAGGISL